MTQMQSPIHVRIGKTSEIARLPASFEIQINTHLNHFSRMFTILIEAI